MTQFEYLSIAVSIVLTLGIAKLLSGLAAAALYFQAVSLVPESPGGITDWKNYFAEARREFFIAQMAYTVVIAINSTIILDMPVINPVQMIHATLILLALLGFLFSSEQMQKAVVLVFATGILFTLFVMDTNVDAPRIQ